MCFKIFAALVLFSNIHISMQFTHKKIHNKIENNKKLLLKKVDGVC